MKKTLFLLLGLLLCGGVRAQSDEYRAEVSRMLELSGGFAAYTGVVDQLLNTYKEVLPVLPEEAWTEIAAEFNSVTVVMLVDMLTPIYAKYLTLEDMQQLCAFYETPIGQKYGRTTPAIQGDALQAGMQMGQQLNDRLMARLREKGYLQ